MISSSASLIQCNLSSALFDFQPTTNTSPSLIVPSKSAIACLNEERTFTWRTYDVVAPQSRSKTAAIFAGLGDLTSARVLSSHKPHPPSEESANITRDAV